jgi:protein-S-isoprenylcysteine O-methyltransferase Ste14
LVEVVYNGRVIPRSVSVPSICLQTAHTVPRYCFRIGRNSGRIEFRPSGKGPPGQKDTMVGFILLPEDGSAFGSCEIRLFRQRGQPVKQHTMPKQGRRRFLELKIPPLAILFLMAALMWLASWATSALRIPVPARTFLGASFAMAGAVVSALGVVSFWRAKTTVNPMNPATSSSLVIGGIYALTRNPMYLGFLLVLIGWAVFLSNSLAFLLLPVFIFYMNRFQIEPEERALASLFGKEFITYESRVRRWL